MQASFQIPSSLACSISAIVSRFPSIVGGGLGPLVNGQERVAIHFYMSSNSMDIPFLKRQILYLGGPLCECLDEAITYVRQRSNDSVCT